MIQQKRYLAILLIMFAAVLSGCRTYKSDDGQLNEQNMNEQVNSDTDDLSKYEFSRYAGDFKVIGYYPSWSEVRVSEEIISRFTHINYAFIIPKEDGTLHEVENPELLEWLVKVAHNNQVKLFISVGGWSYEDELLEGVFERACDTEVKTRILVNQIIDVLEYYNADGVDIDWEYPRINESADKYEQLMTMLRAELDQRKKELTTAVIGNESVIGLGQTNQVLSIADWINVMAYDAEEPGTHSSIAYMESCIDYWKNNRNVPADKIVVGVPFYSHPSRLSYRALIMSDIRASLLDTCIYERMWENYNGIYTIQNKTKLAKQECSGIMFWEITQDAWNSDYSLIERVTDLLESR